MTQRRVFPVSLYVTGRNVLVVGDGERAHERAAWLRECGAHVTQAGQAEYESAVCQGCFLVVAHTGDAALNEAIATDAREAGALAYAHDLPKCSDMAMPALARRGPLVIAISTDGVAPALSRRLREQLEALLATGGETLDDLIAELGSARAALPPGGRSRLYDIASRLTIEGVLVIDDDDP